MKYDYLKEVKSSKTLTFIKKANQKTKQEMTSFSCFKSFKKDLVSIHDKSKSFIAWPTERDGLIYNFWTDKKHEKGLWRRTSKSEYKKPKPVWEILLDVDKLSDKEGRNWEFESVEVCPVNKNLCLIVLSENGNDKKTYREYDLKNKKFVSDGFTLENTLGFLVWKDKNTVIFCEEQEGENSKSGYPLEVKIWDRKQGKDKAKSLYQAKNTSLMVSGSFVEDLNAYLIFESTSFFSTSTFILKKKEKISLPLPKGADFNGIFYGQVLMDLKNPWTFKGVVYPAGSLLSFSYKDFYKKKKIKSIEVVFSPSENQVLEDIVFSKKYLLCSILNDVVPQTLCFTRHGKWIKKESIPEGYVVYDSADDHDNLFLTKKDFLTPPSLYSYSLKKRNLKLLKSTPSLFDADKMEVLKFSAKSKDGTRIPYFVVAPKTMKCDGSNPTVLYGYGGFEVSMVPEYLESTGKLWIERGGVYVLANIRGGNEFGPRWHKQALRSKRHKAFEDFIAVAEDLKKKRITSTQHLAIQGGSNGGLLVGATFTKKPDVCAAVLCQVPLLDMLSYKHLLAGELWVEEYGDPDKKKDRKFLKAYSPFHQVKANKNYPEVLFTTSTEDDRVHPYHARAMYALMKQQGHKVWLFESKVGGHQSQMSLKEAIAQDALEWSFLWSRLKSE